MEVPVGAQEYTEKGRALLLQGQARDAAVAFAHAVKIDPNLVAGHLGLAEANLALGSYGLVHMACRRVQELAPSGPDANLAQALIFVLDRRYDRAVEALEKVTVENPGQAYVHALRGYCLRRMGKDYEAALAEAKAARQAGSVDFNALFPKVEKVETPTDRPTTTPPSQATVEKYREPAWQPPSQVRRQVAQIRFATRNTAIVTTSLILINVVIYLICGLMAGNLLEPTSSVPLGFLYVWGIQDNSLILQGQVWRLLTAMFLHINWLHVGLNMLSLYFVGRPLEQVYGHWRFLVIYFGAGLTGSILVLFLSNAPALGASGAIFGAFAALGVFFWAHRRAFGSSMLTQWVFWLVLNLFFTFGYSNIAVSDHIGGLSMGLLLGLLLMPGFWAPIRVKWKRGQVGDALLLVARPSLVILGIAAALIVLTILFAPGR